MTVATPPRGPELERDRDLERRTGDLEALIEEARRRARRRRQRYWGAALFAAVAGAAALFGFHGSGGGGAGTAAIAGGSGPGGQATEPAPSLAALPGGKPAMAFAFDPRLPNVVYVASPAGSVHVYKTTDDGRHWHSTGAQGEGWSSDILSLTADPLHPGTLFAGTDTAVYKTVDGGRNWRPFNNGLFPPPGAERPFGEPGTTSWNRNAGWVLDVAVDPSDSNVVYSATDAVRKSTDGGNTWKTVLLPPMRWRSSVSRIVIAPTRPVSVYAMAHDIERGRTAIYKSADAGRTWHATGGGTSSLPPSCCWDSTDALAVDPHNPQTLYAAVGGTLLATTDGAATWHPMTSGLPAKGVTSIAADPRRKGVLYASVEVPHTYKTKAGDVEEPTGGIYKTTDDGKTWIEVYSGFGIEKVAVNPTRPSTIYAAGWAGRDPNHPNAFRLLRTTDSGHTWTAAR